MAASRKDGKSSTPRQPPAKTPDGRELQMVSLAMDLAEKQMRDGTASAAVIGHFLKIGAGREKLEREKIRRENLLLESRVNELASSSRNEELYTRALNAMREYSGKEPLSDDEI